MEVKQGYKQTEIGFIPSDWEVYVLGSLLHRIADVDHYMPKTERYGVPYLMTGDIKDYASEIDIDNCKKISIDDFEKLSKKIRTLKGDIILARYATIGSVSYVDIDEDFVVSYSCVTIKPDKSRLNDLFLFHYFKSNVFKLEVKNKVNANIQDNVGIGDLMKMKIPIPPTLAEQAAIATALSDADSYIASLEKLIAKKRLIKQGAMQQLLKPKEGWGVKKLGEIGEFKNGINKGADDFGFGYPFVNLMDVFGISKISQSSHLGLINSNDAERKMYDLKNGDVLFIRSSVKPEGVGLTCVIEKNLESTVFSGFIIRFRDFGTLSNEFKEYCFSSEYFRAQIIASSSVSANTNINQEALKNLVLHFPKSLEEQTRIATILTDMDSEIAALEKKLAKAQQIKQGMMQQLLTGKIRLV